jgi:NAD-dependent deacetylase
VFQQEPERFFNWLHPLATEIANAKPNPAHHAVAELEKAGCIQAVITQNIDHLHQDAGSNNVLELHGSVSTAICTGCQKRFQTAEYLPDFVRTSTIPRCGKCGRILKPEIVLFEELMPALAWNSADDYSEKCDLMIVTGSSLEVIPAGMLPAKASRTGAQIIILNLSPTYMDDQASVVIREDLAVSLPLLIERVL